MDKLMAFLRRVSTRRPLCIEFGEGLEDTAVVEANVLQGFHHSLRRVVAYVCRICFLWKGARNPKLIQIGINRNIPPFVPNPFAEDG